MKIQDYAIAHEIENWTRKKSAQEAGKETGRDNTPQTVDEANPAEP